MKLEDAYQQDLIITPKDQSIVTVDDVEVAQILYLFLSNRNIPRFINAITGKTVLILGRFEPKYRKYILNNIHNKLREYGYVPILFDFKKPNTRDFTETIKILAGLSLFVIADISNPKSVPLELQAIIPEFKIPFVPIIQKGEEPFSMLKDLYNTDGKRVLPLVDYDSCEDLINNKFDKDIIMPAMQAYSELQARKVEELKIRK